MPTYQFYLNKFKITDTRSFHNDTLIAGLGLQINDKVFATTSAQLGDFDNGTFSFWEHKLGSIDGAIIGATDNITFLFQIYNNGHDHQPSINLLNGSLSQDLLKVNVHLDSLGVKKPFMLPDADGSVADAGPDQDPELDSDGNKLDTPSKVLDDILTGGLFSAFSYLFKSCDGPVAFSVFSSTGAQLEEMVNSAPNKVSTTMVTCNGKNLKLGSPCNSSGSNYIIDWIVQHH